MELCGITLGPGSSWPPLQLGQGQRKVLPCTELNSFSVAYTHQLNPLLKTSLRLAPFSLCRLCSTAPEMPRPTSWTELSPRFPSFVAFWPRATRARSAGTLTHSGQCGRVTACLWGSTSQLRYNKGVTFAATLCLFRRHQSISKHLHPASSEV